MSNHNKSTYKLAAIMFTDIVGFSKLVQDNEDRASDILDQHNEIVRPLLENYNLIEN